MNDTEKKTKEAVSNVCYPELGWAFTQNSSYETTLKEVGDKVKNTHRYQGGCTTCGCGGYNCCHCQVSTTRDGVPEDFIRKMITSVGRADETAIRELQVRQFIYILCEMNVWAG